MYIFFRNIRKYSTVHIELKWIKIWEKQKQIITWIDLTLNSIKHYYCWNSFIEIAQKVGKAVKCFKVSTLHNCVFLVCVTKTSIQLWFSFCIALAHIYHASLHTNGTCLPINLLLCTLLRIDAICFYKNLPHECLMRVLSSSLALLYTRKAH